MRIFRFKENVLILLLTRDPNRYNFHSGSVKKVISVRFRFSFQEKDHFLYSVLLYFSPRFGEKMCFRLGSGFGSSIISVFGSVLCFQHAFLYIFFLKVVDRKKLAEIIFDLRLYRAIKRTK
jgi:hypothetical protein